jgi:hypothetical protein
MCPSENGVDSKHSSSFYLPPGSNEPAGKVLLTSENNVIWGHLTIPKYEIVHCGAFIEVIFFRISPKILLRDFFYSL